MFPSFNSLAFNQMSNEDLFRCYFFQKNIIKSVFKFGGKFNQDLSNLENFNIIGKLRNPKQTL